MKKWILGLMLMVPFSACEDADQIINDTLSNEDIAAGLKTALQVGTDTSVTTLSAVNGYFLDEAVKILLPPEASVIFDNLSMLPGGKELVDETILAINRAAEDAAPEAKTIFVDAISSITFDDAKGILQGHDSAATAFLHDKTYNNLSGAFSPKISTSLSKPLIGNASAESLYAGLITKWNTVADNSFGILKPVTSNTLGEYTTKKALDGLFKKVSIEESKIRNDINHRVNDILKKVFK